MKKTVVLGITGSVAAHKVVDLISLLKKNNWDIHIIMTDAAAHMVPVDIFEKATDNPVFVDLFPKEFNHKAVIENKNVDHITIARLADVFVVVPATANTIAKIASGIADNFLTASLLATKAPVIICPAMNTNMWGHQSTQKNIAQLRFFGYRIIEPTIGMLACGYEGKGKLENSTKIVEEIEHVHTYTKRLRGKKILVTVGATQEYIDDIRYITNPSSGKMGIALAEEAFHQGADVLLLRSTTSIPTQYPIQEMVFSSAEELSLLIQDNAVKHDYLFHTAAVGDFGVQHKAAGKLSSALVHTLKLQPQEKIINMVKRVNKHIRLIGFKAEYGLTKKALIQQAHNKLTEAQADMIVANDISKKDSGFGSDTNEAFVVFPNNTHVYLQHAPKREIARQLLSLVFP